MKDLRTIILAAGKGTRMKSAKPKVLHNICGRPLIDYVVDVAKAAGSLKIFVVLGHENEKVKAHLGDQIIPVLQKKLLGTADAVRCAEKAFIELPLGRQNSKSSHRRLDGMERIGVGKGKLNKNHKGDVLILCGDAPLLRRESIKALLKTHRSTKAACTFLTAQVENSHGYGRVIRDVDGRVIAIREENDADENERRIREINVGAYCFDTRVLFEALREVSLNQKKKEFYLTDIIEILSGQRLRVETVRAQDADEGLGVNSREDLARAETLLRRRILKNFMQEGVTLVDPKTTYIQADVKIGRDTVIRPFTVIENDVHIGTNCVIGPFTHLRPGTRIGNSVEVGNFAEVSRSQMGNNCFMKHFSFLGDSSVGNEVNIGAGVVTANFDGKNKNRTKISDKAFIGSDSILVAPVSIGKGAVTGAGCVVTKGSKVPAGGVVVGVPARTVSKKRKNS